MQALGLIETRGLIAAIESADAMLKAAEVTLIEKTIVGGGLVTIAVSGDVGAVKAAVDAGEAAVLQMNSALLISKHVIPRPHQEIEGTIIGVAPKENESTPIVDSENKEPTDEIVMDKESVDDVAMVKDEFIKDVSEFKKEDIDKLVEEKSLEEAINVLNTLTVVKLRRLAREYKTFGIIGREISKADKELLITKFQEYYQ